MLYPTSLDQNQSPPKPYLDSVVTPKSPYGRVRSWLKNAVFAALLSSSAFATTTAIDSFTNQASAQENGQDEVANPEEAAEDNQDEVANPEEAAEDNQDEAANPEEAAEDNQDEAANQEEAAEESQDEAAAPEIFSQAEIFIPLGTHPAKAIADLVISELNTRQVTHNATPTQVLLDMRGHLKAQGDNTPTGQWLIKNLASTNDAISESGKINLKKLTIDQESKTYSLVLSKNVTKLMDRTLDGIINDNQPLTKIPGHRKIIIETTQVEPKKVETRIDQHPVHVLAATIRKELNENEVSCYKSDQDLLLTFLKQARTHKIPGNIPSIIASHTVKAEDAETVEYIYDYTLSNLIQETVSALTPATQESDEEPASPEATEIIIDANTFDNVTDLTLPKGNLDLFKQLYKRHKEAADKNNVIASSFNKFLNNFVVELRKNGNKQKLADFLNLELTHANLDGYTGAEDNVRYLVTRPGQFNQNLIHSFKQDDVRPVINTSHTVQQLELAVLKETTKETKKYKDRIKEAFGDEYETYRQDTFTPINEVPEKSTVQKELTIIAHNYINDVDQPPTQAEQIKTLRQLFIAYHTLHKGTFANFKIWLKEQLSTHEDVSITNEMADVITLAKKQHLDKQQAATQ